MGSNPVSKQRICMKKETSLCNTVCLVIKLLRHHFVEILQLLMLQDLCVQSCHTVNRVACCNCKMCHLYLSVIDDCHLADLFLITGIHLLDLQDKSAVDLLNDLIYSWKEP